jgi:hypothetical protein
MSDPAKRKPVFICLICLEPSYYSEIEIDFEKYGERKFKICGECMRDEDKSGFIVHHVAERLLGDVPTDIVAARVYEVLSEYHQPPQQGS